MTPNYKRWQKLFLFCLGLALGSAFCMKWMENDLWQNGEKFTILGLELSYGREKIMAIMAGLDPTTRTILGYHLHFDFAFMVGVFPLAAALCMMAREKIKATGWGRFFVVLAALQLLAWGCDIYENLALLNWMDQPIPAAAFQKYQWIVWTKWILVVPGILLPLPFLLRRKKS